MAIIYLHPALIGGRVYLAPVLPPNTDPEPEPAPFGVPQIYCATIMRASIINLTANLGPSAINLTARLP